MQEPLELILSRQWASHLAYPVWLYNDQGELIYFNEPAEELLGFHSVSAHEVKAKDLNKIFKYESVDGSTPSVEGFPINIALSKKHPAHGKLNIRSLDGTWKMIESTSFPIIGQGGRFLGALSIFWEIKSS